MTPSVNIVILLDHAGQKGQHAGQYDSQAPNKVVGERLASANCCCRSYAAAGSNAGMVLAGLILAQKPAAAANVY